MAAMSGVAVEFRDVSFAAGAAPARVDGLSLAIAAGETLVLLGRSGSGKTTTLKLINALLMPTRGEVHVGGRSTGEWDAVTLRRNTGYVIQEGGLFPHFDVRRNVAMVPTLLGWPAERIRARVDELLDLVGLAPQTYGP